MNDFYYTVHGWMIHDLNLRGAELTLYASIYGFSKDGGEMVGSISYLQNRLGLTKPTIIKSISELVKKGLITEFQRTRNSTKCYKSTSVDNFLNQQKTSKETLPAGSKEILRSSKETLPQVVKKFNETSKKTLPNNNTKYITNNINNNVISESIDSPTKKPKVILDFSALKNCNKESQDAIVEIRKTAKAKLTQLALDGLVKELNKAQDAGMSLSDCLTEWSVRGWKAFKYEWVLNSTVAATKQDIWNPDRSKPSAPRRGTFDDLVEEFRNTPPLDLSQDSDFIEHEQYLLNNFKGN